MKKAIFTIIAILFATVACFAQKSVTVSSYYRSNGTYVQSHYRTAPNNTVLDNWSTVGNTNPYTGQAGTKNYSSGNYSTSTYTSYPSSYSYRVTYPVVRTYRTYSYRTRY